MWRKEVISAGHSEDTLVKARKAATDGLCYVHICSQGPVFIKHLKSNVYVTLNAIGSFQSNLCSHWLIQIFITSVSL